MSITICLTNYFQYHCQWSGGNCSLIQWIREQIYFTKYTFFPLKITNLVSRSHKKAYFIWMNMLLLLYKLSWYILGCVQYLHPKVEVNIQKLSMQKKIWATKPVENWENFLISKITLEIIIWDIRSYFELSYHFWNYSIDYQFQHTLCNKVNLTDVNYDAIMAKQKLESLMASV